MSAGCGETYLRLLAEAELRQGPVLAAPGPHIHRMWLAATALTAARDVDPGAAWQVLADFEMAARLRNGDARAILRSAHPPHWARWARPGPPAAGGPAAAPVAIPIGATLPLPPEREGWYGELQLLCLARTSDQAAITVATRWVGQARRSATPRPRHAPFHQVGALDDSGTSHPGALWDMGIEDGRDWWDCHLGLTPALLAATRWLEVGPGAGGRCVRAKRRDRRRRVVAMLEHELHRIARLERQPAREHPVEDDAEGVDVGCFARWCALRLLR